jgi:hypothetical protein
MVRNGERLLFPDLVDPAQFDVAASLRKNEEAELLEDRGDFRPG